MTWEEFDEGVDTWDEAALEAAIYEVEKYGEDWEVAYLATALPTDMLKIRLIREAIRRKVPFSYRYFYYLYGEIPESAYRELANYAGFDADALEWDEFYFDCEEWSEELTLTRIEKLKSFGPADEVSYVIEDMLTSRRCKNALYRRAVTEGVAFTEEQLIDMGCKKAPPIEMEVRHTSRGGSGFWGVVAGVASLVADGGARRAAARHCNGDCDNCPPHYGYRYGRWYYGHGHQHGCQRGGNGGASLRTLRD